MDSDEDPRSVRGIQNRAPIALNRDCASCETLRSRRSEGDYKSGIDGFDFVKQPIRQILISPALGRLCSRRLPRCSNLKCLTALVT